MLSRFFLKRPVFAWVIAIVMMVLGLLAIYSLPIAQYPPIAPPSIRVLASYCISIKQLRQSSGGGRGPTRPQIRRYAAPGNRRHDDRGRGALGREAVDGPQAVDAVPHGIDDAPAADGSAQAHGQGADDDGPGRDQKL
jgi:hypothetical protein